MLNQSKFLAAPPAGQFSVGANGSGIWVLAEDAFSIALIETMLGTGKPVAAVCVAPGVLRHAKALSGEPVVAGKSVTGFINSEEEAAGLSAVVPFLVEDMLRTNKGTYSRTRTVSPTLLQTAC